MKLISIFHPFPGLATPDYVQEVQSPIEQPLVMPVDGANTALVNSRAQLAKNRDECHAEIKRLTEYHDELSVAIKALDAGLQVITEHNVSAQVMGADLG